VAGAEKWDGAGARIVKHASRSLPSRFVKNVEYQPVRMVGAKNVKQACLRIK
jgi:hypothetical protein